MSFIICPACRGVNGVIGTKIFECFCPPAKIKLGGGNTYVEPSKAFKFLTMTIRANYDHKSSLDYLAGI